MKLNAILLFSILINVFTPCKGQNKAQISNNTISDTVSEIDKSIWYIFQDKNNNFWFGSDGKGVYRYDGKTTTRFSTEDGLCNNRIREIQEDRSGNIFFTTMNGICKFDGQKFTTLTVSKNNNSHNAWKLEPDDLWFKGESGKKGPYRYDGKSLYHLEFPKHYLEDEFYTNHPNTTYSPYDMYTIYKDRRGNIWFGTSNLVYAVTMGNP